MKLTLCIPSYNRDAYLEECLQCIQAQTFKDFQIVVLDNASSQDYHRVLQQFPDLDIKYIRNPKNIGAVENIRRALGLRNHSLFLMMFNDDDLMHPRLLEYEMRIMRENPQVLFVATELRGFTDGEAVSFDCWGNVKGEHEIYDDASELARVLLQGTPLHFGSVMYRSSALEGLTLDSDRFSMIADRPFLLKIARKGSCALVREPLVLYRLHAAQDSKSDVLTENNIMELLAEYRSCFPINWSRADQTLFLRHSTNNLLDSYNRLIETKRSNLARFIYKCRVRGLLDLRYLNTMGLEAVCRALGVAWLTYLWQWPRSLARRLGLRREHLQCLGLVKKRV